MDGILKRKHDDIQEGKRKGLFTEGSYPEHHYPIGENFFVLASEYKNKAAIHIRKFNRYGDNYYPSTVGLTLKYEQFAICFSHDPPTSIFDIVEINQALEVVNEDNKKEFYLLMTDDGNINLTNEHTCRSGRVYKFPVNITYSQWRAIVKVYDDVISSFIALKYRSRDFKETFKMVTKRSLPVEKPVYSRYTEAEQSINNCLVFVLYRHIGEKKGLRPPMRIGDEDIEISELSSVRDFNESCMCLNVQGIARDFEKELVTNELYPERVPLIDYLSEQYLEAIKLDKCLQDARKDFCSDEF